MNSNHQFYLSLLKVNICSVTFIKVNGDTRVMRCTLNPSVIPVSEYSEDKLKEDTETQGASKDVIRVYDLEVMGWRSFRVDSVIVFEIV